eukprot:7668011-Ditylum_brightwellii.AAC.1
MDAKGTKHIAYSLVDSFHYPIGLQILSSYWAFNYSVISLYHFCKFGHELGPSVQHYFHRPGVSIKPCLLYDICNDVSTFSFNFCHLKPSGSWIDHGHAP